MIQHLQDQAVQIRRERRAKRAGRQDLFGEEMRKSAGLGAVLQTAYRNLAVRQQFIGDHSQREEIGAPVYALGRQELFRRHVFRRAAEQALGPALFGRRREAEIHDDRQGNVVVLDKDVRRLEIAMGYLRMRHRERFGQLAQYGQARLDRLEQPATVFLHPALEILPVNEVHHNADPARTFVEIVDRADVRMTQLARDQDLATQRIDVAAILAMDLLEDLDGERNAELLVD